MGLLDRTAKRLLEQLHLNVRPQATDIGQGGHRSKMRATGLEFADHRLYAPGDDIRHIDWKAFARNRQLLVKTFEEERDVSIYVLLDVSLSMTRGEPTKLDVGKTLAAAFAYLGMKQFDRVQLIPFGTDLGGLGGKAGAGRQLGRSKARFPIVEKALERVEAEGVTRFADTTRAFAGRHSRQGLVVVISDLMEAADWGESFRTMASLGHELWVVRTACDEDERPSFKGELELEDVERGGNVRVRISKSLLAAYQQEVANHIAACRDACVRVGGRFLDAPVEHSTEELLKLCAGPESAGRMTFVGLPLVAVIAAVVAVMAVVVALYLLKSTPRPQPVSNVDFWVRAMERAQPTWLFSRSIPLLAMLLTLIVALLIIFFAADPRLHHVASTTTVVVIDAGRTMGAGEEDARRIDEALELLEEVVAESARMGQVAVVRAGIRPSLLLPLTGSSHELGAALAGHRLDDGPSDLTAAVSLADTIVARRRSGDDGRVIVISDRHPPTTAVQAPLTLLPVGSEGQTVGIVAFGARRDPTAIGEYGVFCEVRAFTEKAARARLVIRDRDVVIADEELELEPGKSVAHAGRGFAGDASEVTARLEAIEIEGSQDAFAADDSAYAVVRPLARTRVLVVTTGNRFLEAVLRVNPSLEVERATPAAFDGGQLSTDFDVVILDRHLPARAITAAGVMLVAPPRRDDRLRFGPTVNGLTVTSAQSNHPVLDEVALEAVSVRRARPLLPEPEDRALFRSGRHVLATTREERGDRRVVFGFDFNDTDLVEGPAFPLMMHNAVVWLANEQTLARSSIHPGQPLTFTGQLAAVELPSGMTSDARGGLFFGTSSTGIYRVDERPQAVSSVDFAAPLQAQPPGEARAAMATEPPLSLILALLLLGLIATEWFLFHRGRV